MGKYENYPTLSHYINFLIWGHVMTVYMTVLRQTEEYLTVHEKGHSTDEMFSLVFFFFLLNQNYIPLDKAYFSTEKYGYFSYFYTKTCHGTN